MTPTYDRRVNDALLAALEPNGWAHDLVEYSRSGMWGLDLRLRGRALKDHRATLYVGTTKVLDLFVSESGRARLSAANSYRTGDLGWDEAWTRTTEQAELADRWSAVSDYLDQSIARVISQETYLQEGIVQAAIGNATSRWTYVDREVALSFADTAEKEAFLAATSRPWVELAERADRPAWWKLPGISTECDLLAIDDDGGLVAVEVKPHCASATATAWSPVQARQYADQLQAWLGVAGSEAAQILTEMLQQQARIGTRLSTDVPNVDVDRPVRAVVAIDARTRPVQRDRMAEVMQHYRESGNGLRAEVYEVDLIGRLAPVPT